MARSNSLWAFAVESAEFVTFSVSFWPECEPCGGCYELDVYASLSHNGHWQRERFRRIPHLDLPQALRLAERSAHTTRVAVDQGRMPLPQLEQLPLDVE